MLTSFSDGTTSVATLGSEPRRTADLRTCYRAATVRGRDHDAAGRGQPLLPGLLRGADECHRARRAAGQRLPRLPRHDRAPGRHAPADPAGRLLGRRLAPEVPGGRTALLQGAP